MTRRPGVCMGASGPGATNLLTGVANAFTDCAPLIAIGGSSPRVFFGMEAFQEIDQLAVFKPVTKWAERIYDAKRIPDVVATAFRQATSGRPGPVYIDMPGDVLGEKIEEDKVTYPPAVEAGAAHARATPARSRRPSRCSRRPSARWSSPAAACGGRTARPRSRPSSRPRAFRSTPRRSRAA